MPRLLILFISGFQVVSYEKPTFLTNTVEQMCSSVHQTECSPNSAQLVKSVFVKNVGWASQVRNS